MPGPKFGPEAGDAPFWGSGPGFLEFSGSFSPKFERDSKSFVGFFGLAVGFVLSGVVLDSGVVVVTVVGAGVDDGGVVVSVVDDGGVVVGAVDGTVVGEVGGVVGDGGVVVGSSVDESGVVLEEVVVVVA